MLRELQFRIKCAVHTYRAAMQYKGAPGDSPRDVAREQIRLFLEAVEREYSPLSRGQAPAYMSRETHGYFHKEF